MSSSNSDGTPAKRVTIADTPSARKRASLPPDVGSEAPAAPLADEPIDDEQVDDERPTIPVPPNAP